MGANFRQVYGSKLEQADFELYLSALKSLGFVIVDEGTSSDNGIITARAKMTLKSWGENIVVTQMGNNQIEVQSSCRLSTQVFDWGKNESNVKKIISALKSLQIDSPTIAST